MCDARKRPLIRARDSERVPNSYFVHIRQSASLDKLKEIVQDLTNRSTQDGPFKASISAIVTRAAFGFSAKFSEVALDSVSITETTGSIATIECN